MLSLKYSYKFAQIHVQRVQYGRYIVCRSCAVNSEAKKSGFELYWWRCWGACPIIYIGNGVSVANDCDMCVRQNTINKRRWQPASLPDETGGLPVPVEDVSIESCSGSLYSVLSINCRYSIKHIHSDTDHNCFQRCCWWRAVSRGMFALRAHLGWASHDHL